MQQSEDDGKDRKSKDCTPSQSKKSGSDNEGEESSKGSENEKEGAEVERGFPAESHKQQTGPVEEEKIEEEDATKDASVSQEKGPRRSKRLSKKLRMASTAAVPAVTTKGKQRQRIKRGENNAKSAKVIQKNSENMSAGKTMKRQNEQRKKEEGQTEVRGTKNSNKRKTLKTKPNKKKIEDTKNNSHVEKEEKEEEEQPKKTRKRKTREDDDENEHENKERENEKENAFPKRRTKRRKIRKRESAKAGIFIVEALLKVKRDPKTSKRKFLIKWKGKNNNHPHSPLPCVLPFSQLSNFRTAFFFLFEYSPRFTLYAFNLIPSSI